MSDTPQVVAAKEHLTSLNGRLLSESQRVTRLVSTSDAVNRQREAETRAALEAQRARVLDLLNGNNVAAVLQRDVDSARQALETAMTKQSQTSLESELQQVNVYLLANAVAPNRASSPRILMNTALAVIAGLLVGMLTAIWKESCAPVIRSVDDLLVALDQPLLGTVHFDTRVVETPSFSRRLVRRLATS